MEVIDEFITNEYGTSEYYENPMDFKITDFEEENPGKFKEGVSNIIVAIRIRPLKGQEIVINNQEIISTIGNKTIGLRENYTGEAEDVFRSERSREKYYTFDHVFNKEISQHTIYMKSTRNLLDGVLEGYNATVFAYGATGAGKTYTMLGIPESPGLMSITIKSFLKKCK